MTRLMPRVERDSPGLFVNPQWRPGTPGTFAVVIGVSAYPYLEGGSEYRLGDEVFTLGQLHVSAATARAFFEWLADRYDFPTAPPALCWLLLSPTVTELQAFGVSTVEALGAAPATLTNCELAIHSWYQAMAQITVGDAAASRSFFFFSGHGLEVALDAQILLPSDYLRGPGRSVNDAISTANLLKGLAGSRVNNHFLFADACRNDVPQLREYVIEGRPILNVRSAAGTNPDAVAGILYAAASGTETWQPRELEEGLSLFGESVVTGLVGSRTELKGCVDQRCEIQFNPLATCVKGRMAERLADFGSPQKVRVRQGGSPPDVGITFVEEVSAGAFGPCAAAPVLKARYDVVHSGLAWTPGQDWGAAHEFFGSERMTDIWDLSARAHDLGTGLEVPREELMIREVRRSSDTKAFRIAVQLPSSPDGHWLSFTDPRGQRFAASLAGDKWVRPVYELTIDFELDEHSYIDSSSRWVSSVEARLSPLSGGLLGRIAEIWDTYETDNVAIAVGELDVDHLRQMVMDKRDFPLAATVAAVLLLRARRLDLLPASWLVNLSNWFPDNPDAPVLRVERQRLRAVDATEPAVALEQLSRLFARGLPRLAELLPVAWRQLTELGEQQPATPWRPALQEQLRQAMRYYRPGGLFAVYSSPVDPLDVAMVRPTVIPPTP